MPEPLPCNSDHGIWIDGNANKKIRTRISRCIDHLDRFATNFIFLRKTLKDGTPYLGIKGWDLHASGNVCAECLELYKTDEDAYRIAQQPPPSTEKTN